MSLISDIILVICQQRLKRDLLPRTCGLRHENLSPFYGYMFGRDPCLVLPAPTHGLLRVYIIENPNLDMREKLRLVGVVCDP